MIIIEDKCWSVNTRYYNFYIHERINLHVLSSIILTFDLLIITLFILNNTFIILIFVWLADIYHFFYFYYASSM